MLAIRELPTPNEDDRRADVPIDMLILHYTGMRSAREAIERLRDPAAKVSSHYVVDEDGFVLRLVAEERRAYHAGVSYWRGHSDLNGRSIGIEIVNPEHQAGYRDFRAPPLDAVCDLCLSILSRHAIPARSDRPTQDTELSFAVRQEE
jgi:N-acetylmuramoyl-L-alanine amidase